MQCSPALSLAVLQHHQCQNKVHQGCGALKLEVSSAQPENRKKRPQPPLSMVVTDNSSLQKHNIESISRYLLVGDYMVLFKNGLLGRCKCPLRSARKHIYICIKTGEFYLSLKKQLLLSSTPFYYSHMFFLRIANQKSIQRYLISFFFSLMT